MPAAKKQEVNTLAKVQHIFSLCLRDDIAIYQKSERGEDWCSIQLWTILVTLRCVRDDTFFVEVLESGYDFVTRPFLNVTGLCCFFYEDANVRRENVGQPVERKSQTASFLERCIQRFEGPINGEMFA
jgi:hypothetical protein